MFLRDQTGLNGLADPNVDPNQEIYSGHQQRTHNEIKLVIEHFHATAERGLESLVLRVGNGTPCHRIEKRLKNARYVEIIQRWESGYAWESERLASSALAPWGTGWKKLIAVLPASIKPGGNTGAARTSPITWI